MKDKILSQLYRNDFRKKLHDKMVDSAIFGNEDEYICKNFMPTMEHNTLDEVTKQLKEKPYVPYLATLVKTMASFFLASMTDFIIDEVLRAIKEIKDN